MRLSLTGKCGDLRSRAGLIAESVTFWLNTIFRGRLCWTRVGCLSYVGKISFIY